MKIMTSALHGVALSFAVAFSAAAQADALEQVTCELDPPIHLVNRDGKSNNIGSLGYDGPASVLRLQNYLNTLPAAEASPLDPDSDPCDTKMISAVRDAFKGGDLAVFVSYLGNMEIVRGAVADVCEDYKPFQGKILYTDPGHLCP